MLIVNEHSVGFAQIIFPSVFMWFMNLKVKVEIEMLVGGSAFNTS